MIKRIITNTKIMKMQTISVFLKTKSNLAPSQNNYKFTYRGQCYQNLWT
jgi:hypothetical protein